MNSIKNSKKLNEPMGKLLILLAILPFMMSCNKQRKKDDSCALDKVYNSKMIEFNGFEKNSISKLEIRNLNNEKINIHLNEIDSISTHNLFINLKNNKEEWINENIFLIVINDSLKYKISDIKTENIKRFGNFGLVGYFCEISEYKLNDSLIKNNKIVIFK